MSSRTRKVIREEDEDDIAEGRDCKSPNEGIYGDDEMRESEEKPKPTRRVKKAVSINEDESDQETPRFTGKTRRGSNRTFSSSEDENKPARKSSFSRMSIKDRKMSLEHASSDSNEKRDRFAKARAQSMQSGRGAGDENRPPRRLSRHGSTTTSEGEDHHHQTAAERRSKYEKQASKDFLTNSQRRSSKPSIHGGATGASTLKERFENKAIESKKVVTSSPRTFGSDAVDSSGGEERHSAASLKARFENKIKDNAPPVKRNFVINKSGGGAAKKFGGGAPVSNKCFVCTKTVYPMEKLEADKHIYHKFCFKCKTCNRTVGLGNYAALEGDIYCKPHLKQLFKLKGNYDEGFGREQRKADWVNKDAKPSSRKNTKTETPAEPAAAEVVNGDAGGSDGEGGDE